MNFLVVLETRVQNALYRAQIKVSAEVVPHRGFGGVIHSFLLPASGGCQRSLACSRVTQPLRLWSHCFLFCSQISLYLLPVSTPLITFKAHPNHPGQPPISESLTMKAFCCIRSHSQVWGTRMWMSLRAFSASDSTHYEIPRN